MTGNPRDVLDVRPMDIQTAVTLLRKKLVGDVGSDGDLASLVKCLDKMPLAITQAAALINRRAPRLTASKFLRDMSSGDADLAKLLQQDMKDPRRDREASNSIIATWHTSFEYIRRERPSAARLLSLMSLFDPKAIPESLLYSYADGSDEVDADFERDIDMLKDLCLIDMSADGGTFEMHQLVQFSTKKWLELHNEQGKWQKRYVAIMLEAFPEGTYSNWPVCQPLYPHVAAMLPFQLEEVADLECWAKVISRAAVYAMWKGQYSIAEGICRRAVQGYKNSLGENHPDTFSSVDKLGCALRFQGKYQEAEEMHRRALQGREKALGENHPGTLRSANNLGITLRCQRMYQDSEEMHRRALTGRIKLLGEEHPDTLLSMWNLASLFDAQNRLQDAFPYYQRAAAGLEKVLGPDHPEARDCRKEFSSMLEKLRRLGQPAEQSR